MMKHLRLVLAAWLLAGSCLGESLDISTLGQFFVTPNHGVPSSCGDFAMVQHEVHFANGSTTISDTGFDTTGVKLQYAIATSGQTGGAAVFTDGMNTYTKGQVLSFQRTDGTAAWQTNVVWYCVNPITTNALNISLTGTNPAYAFFAFTCSGTVSFDRETVNSSTTGATIQPGSQTPNGTELFIVGGGWEQDAAFAVDSPFAGSEINASGGFVGAAFATNASASALNPTMTVTGPNNSKTVSMMSFRSTGCSPPPSDTPFITAGQGTSRHDFTGVVGMNFTPSVNITVTSLGRMVFTGNTATHVIYLADVVGNTIVSATVVTSGQTANTYSYTPCTPTVLTSGAVYHIMSAEVNGGDDWGNDNATVTSTADGVVGASTFANGPNINPSTSTSGSFCFGPVNFLYH